MRNDIEMDDLLVIVLEVLDFDGLVALDSALNIADS